MPPLRFVDGASRALAAAIVPSAKALSEAGWLEMAGVVETALKDRPRSLKAQLSLFTAILEWAPVFLHGRRLSRLDPERRARLLHRVENGPLFLRRGFWGVRTLVYLGFYGRPEAGAEIGYRASREGWDRRR